MSNWVLLGRLGLALALSSSIGVEREFRRKAAGLRTITLVVPASVLHALGANDQYGRPTQTAAKAGSRFYDATAFSFQNASPDPSTQGWMTQLDNTPAFDFLLPK